MTDRSLSKWTQFPTEWIRRGELKKFAWSRHGGTATAALMVLLALGQRLAPDHTEVSATYDDLTKSLSISRATLSRAITLLREHHFLDTTVEKRSTFRLNFRPEPWGKLPARPLYSSGVMLPFEHWKLRNIDEMNALKIYFYLISARDRQTNYILSTYPTFEKYTGVHVGSVRSAMSVLTHSRLVVVERQSSRFHEKKEPNIYRLVGLDGYTHFATMAAPPEALTSPPWDGPFST